MNKDKNTTIGCGTFLFIIVIMAILCMVAEQIIPKILAVYLFTKIPL